MSVKQIIKQSLEYYRYIQAKRSHIHTIDDMRKGCQIKPLSAEQKREIKQYYKENFGVDVNLKWHEYYSSVNGIYSPEYIPTYLYYTKICPKMNVPKQMAMYSDKNMIDKFIPSAKIPKTYVKNINGYFYIDGSPASFEEAVKACDSLNDAIIKHSIDTCKGKSVTRFSSAAGSAFIKNNKSKQSVRDLLLSYDKNYIVQSAISQCDKMASLNPTSLNTVRITTYKRQSDVVVLFTVVRMGRKGAVVDNASAGGLYCGVNQDGSLKKEAYTLTPFSKTEVSDNGVRFEEFVVPKYEEMIALVKQWHNELPYAKIIGWDLAVDENEDIVLVEINATPPPGLFQAATGPAFGKYIIDIFNDADVKSCNKNNSCK